MAGARRTARRQRGGREAENAMLPCWCTPVSFERVLGSPAFGDGKQVAIGIFEPRHLRATRSQPNPQAVLLQERVALACHAALREPQNRLPNVRYLPAECGKGVWLHLLDLLDSQLDACAVERDRKLIVAHEAQTKGVLVECLRAGRAGRREERGEGRFTEHQGPAFRGVA